MRPNNDELITLESALLPHAQAEAVKLYAFNDTHDSIMESERVSDRLNEILEAWYRRQEASEKPDVSRSKA